MQINSDTFDDIAKSEQLGNRLGKAQILWGLIGFMITLTMYYAQISNSVNWLFAMVGVVVFGVMQWFKGSAYVAAHNLRTKRLRELKSEFQSLHRDEERVYQNLDRVISDRFMKWLEKKFTTDQYEVSVKGTNLHVMRGRI